MSEKITKAVNLTKDEVQVLIENHGIRISSDNANERIERIKYLHTRLKSFS